AGVTGWQIYGKTGTTDIDDNSYFVGGSPYAVIGVWTGYQNPSRLRNTNASKSVFQSLMGAYLNTKQLKQFTTDSSVTSAVYCTQSGNLADCAVQQQLVGMKEAICLQNVRNIKIQIQHRPVLKRRKKALPAIQAVQKAAHHPVLPVPLPAQVPVRHRLHLLRQLK
ncbi:MAG: hypothetical protein ACLRX7_07495, partial [Acutalibacteraceae bacterium]